ncbi:hypothetical protein NX773_22550 [Massilia solisilvae]|uniref:Uncharacterized protein n=1 Tax=Massilia solisilvae TaxID=1811225 RepID=A0ABT2BR07_9BURK|nr:hypothetical protein [Massilia solisilvae]MCS0610947.1 hypothetical protein [Massilia solisilvae]
MKTVFHRFYADYLMPSRLGEYEAVLRQAKEMDYAQLPVRDFFRALAQPATLPERVLVHRHDIDSDLRTAKKLFAVESRHGIQATYYFRLCTLDFGFMREIAAAGSEASYHYEEVSDFAKRHRIRDADALRKRFPEIRELFIRNFDSIRQRLGMPLATVASHGDFANRRLNVINHELLRDPDLRAHCGIECEAYDEPLLRNIDMYISDRKYPVYYRPMSPFDALGQHRRILFLTHPVQWETNWVDNTRLNARRLVEELAWRA